MVMTWEYMAGFFDGEGSVKLSNGERKGGSGSPKLGLYQSGQRGLVLLKEIQDFMVPYGIISTIRQLPPIPKRQLMYQLYVYNRIGVMTFVQHVFPYLRIKKLESQDLMRYLKLFPISTGNRIFKKPVPVRSHCGKGHELAVSGTYDYYSSEGRKRSDCMQCAKDRAAARYVKIVGDRDRFIQRCRCAAEVSQWL